MGDRLVGGLAEPLCDQRFLVNGDIAALAVHPIASVTGGAAIGVGLRNTLALSRRLGASGLDQIFVCCTTSEYF